MTVHIGTSGWQYRHWRGLFYPATLPARLWLEHYAARFATVEVNNTFYRLPPAETFHSWRQRTPADFLLAPKASRYLSHVRRLRDPAEPVSRFVERARALGAKLGPVLVQLPPDMEADAGRLDDTLARFPGHVRVAVEFRHATWFSEAVRGILESHGAALCLADRDETALTPLWHTAGWTYLRFHAGRNSPFPCYRRATLRDWVERLREWDGEDVYVYFNNDGAGCAPRDAVRFAGLARQAGWPVTRVPDEAQTPALGGGC